MNVGERPPQYEMGFFRFSDDSNDFRHLYFKKNGVA